MPYQVSRNGSTYGPYTTEELQRYLASGNILPTDLARLDETSDWLPVSQILATVAPPPASFPAPGSAVLPPAGSAPAYPVPTPAALAASRYPDPPDLHWGLLLVLSMVSNGLFQIIWEFVQTSWLKKVQPGTTALTKYIIAYGSLIGGVLLAILGGGILAATTQGNRTSIPGILLIVLGGFGYFGGLVMIFVARFSQRTSLLEHFNGPEPVGLQLSGAMTFFFGSLYFQYHLNRINKLKQAARMGYPAPY